MPFEINEVATGGVVRRALDAITDTDWQQSRGDAERQQVAAFRSRLLDNTVGPVGVDTARPGVPERC